MKPKTQFLHWASPETAASRAYPLALALPWRPRIFSNALLLAILLGPFSSELLMAQEQHPAAAAPKQTTTPQPKYADISVAPSAPSAALPSSAGMDGLDNKHKLAIGDQVSIRILEDEDAPKTLSVTDSGDIESPYIGRQSAEGKTCRELAFALKTDLEKKYYYQATVIVSVDVMTKSRGRVYLVGPIRVPGPQDIPSDETFTLSKAILRAGGFTDFANKHHVKVTRRARTSGGRDQTFVVDVGSILENGKTDADLKLEPDDFIYVPDRLIRF